jgi:hypothetical protein
MDGSLPGATSSHAIFIRAFDHSRPVAVKIIDIVEGKEALVDMKSLAIQLLKKKAFALQSFPVLLFTNFSRFSVASSSAHSVEFWSRCTVWAKSFVGVQNRFL